MGIESNYTVSRISVTGQFNFTINGVSSFPDNVRLMRVGFDTAVILWTPLSYNETFVLDVYGFMEHRGQPTAWSVFTPQIQLCNCQNGGTCTTDGVLQYESSFVIVQCLCTPGNYWCCVSDSIGIATRKLSYKLSHSTKETLAPLYYRLILFTEYPRQFFVEGRGITFSLGSLKPCFTD